MEGDTVAVIPPSIDPFSAKNEVLDDAALPLFLAQIGMTSAPPHRKAVFTRRDGTRGEVVRSGFIVAQGDAPDAMGNLVVQVSRWDALKDMQGVMAGFASQVVGRLMRTWRWSDRPPRVWPTTPRRWRSSSAAWPTGTRCHLGAPLAVRLVSLPMDDLEENAAMVNAIQRSATVVVQKSLAEGFGLTVAEGMWKGKPLVASRVGGITDQVAPGTGVLLDDPRDLVAFGDSLAALLERPDEMARLGAGARRHVTEHFIGDRHLLQWAALIDRLLDA